MLVCLVGLWLCYCPLVLLVATKVILCSHPGCDSVDYCRTAFRLHSFIWSSQVCKALGVRRFEELSFMRCANPSSGQENVAIQYFSSRTKAPIHTHLEPGPDHTGDGCIKGAEYLVSGQSVGLVVRSEEVADHMFMDRMVSTTNDRAFLNGL